MGIFNFLKKKNGLTKSWYPNGQLESEANYKDGKRDGLTKSWYPDGQLEKEVNYKDGKRDGLAKSWDEDGQLQLETHHKDGKQAHLRGSEVSALKAEGKAKTKGNLFISLLFAFLTLITVAIATEGSDEPFVMIMPAVASYLVFRYVRNKEARDDLEFYTPGNAYIDRAAAKVSLELDNNDTGFEKAMGAEQSDAVETDTNDAEAKEGKNTRVDAQKVPALGASFSKKNILLILIVLGVLVAILIKIGYSQGSVLYDELTNKGTEASPLVCFV